MKTIIVKAYVHTRYVGSKAEDKIEVYVDDEATEHEIEQAKEDAVREWMYDQIEWGYEDLE